MKIALLVLLLAVAGASALYADTGGMLPEAGTRSFSGLITPELHVGRHDRGDVTWVRKYEGQRDDVWSLGTVNLLAREELRRFTRGLTGRVSDAELVRMAEEGIKLGREVVALLRHAALLRFIAGRNVADVQRAPRSTPKKA